VRRQGLILALILSLLLAACGRPAVPPATPALDPDGAGSRATVSVGIAYHTAQPPAVVYLPTGTGTVPTATALPAPAPLRAARGSGSAPGAAAVEFHGWRVACVGTERPPGTLVWSPAGHRLQAVGAWLVVAVEVRNTERTARSIWGEDFAVTDARGRVFPFPLMLGGTDYSAFRGGQRLGEPIAPGAAARYYVAFDVAREAQGLRLLFHGAQPSAAWVEVARDLDR
jgi:hypothetical protein